MYIHKSKEHTWFIENKKYLNRDLLSTYMRIFIFNSRDMLEIMFLINICFQHISRNFYKHFQIRFKFCRCNYPSLPCYSVNEIVQSISWFFLTVNIRIFLNATHAYNNEHVKFPHLTISNKQVGRCINMAHNYSAVIITALRKYTIYRRQRQVFLFV